MADPIKVYDLAAGGVNVDVDPLLLADNEFRSTQNLTHDPLATHAGAVRKRPGLQRMHAFALAGPVLGGIGMTVAGTGGAPSGGGGGMGDPGSGGSTGSDTSGSSYGSGGDVSGAGGSGSSGGTRAVVVPLVCGFTEGSADAKPTGFMGLTVTDAGVITLSTALITTPDATGYAAGANNIDRPQVGGVSIVGNEGTIGAPGRAVNVGTTLYFPLNVKDTNGNAAAIGRWVNGSYSNTPWVKLSPSTLFVSGVPSPSVMEITSMMASGGYLFLSVYDSFNNEPEGSNPYYGRVVQVLISTGAAIELFSSNALAPYSLALHNASMFFGGHESNGSQINAYVRKITSAGAATRELFLARPFRRTTCLCSFNGFLYAGFEMASASGHALTAPHIYQRDALANWTDVYTVTSDDTLVERNYVTSMMVFNGKMYIAYYNDSNYASIISYDGTNFTIQKKFTSNAFPITLQSDGTVLYAMGATSGGSSDVRCWTSIDGSNWTDYSSVVQKGLAASSTVGANTICPVGGMVRLV